MTLLLSALALSGCNATSAVLGDPNAGQTDDAAVGFANIGPDSEESFIIRVIRGAAIIILHPIIGDCGSLSVEDSLVSGTCCPADVAILLLRVDVILLVRTLSISGNIHVK